MQASLEVSHGKVHEVYTFRTEDLEELFIAVYVVVDDFYQQHVPETIKHRPGPTSPFTDSEVITINLVGEMLGIDSEKSWVRFIRKNFRYLFPVLPKRREFNRRHRCLWKVIDLLRWEIVMELGTDTICLVDSIPVPICDFKRAHFSTSPLKAYAGYGHCESKALGTFYGFKVHLLVTSYGLPVAFILVSADKADVEMVWPLVEGLHGIILIGDKGYVSQQLAEGLKSVQGIHLYALRRSNQKQQYPKHLRRMLNRFRKRIETTLSQLVDQFHIARVRAHSYWGVLTRLSTKMAAFTVGVYLNHKAGLQLMALKELAF